MRTDLSALLNWRQRMRSLFQRVFRSAPTLTLSQWADLHAVVPSSSAEPGRWRTDRVPYLREPMDAISDPAVREMVVMKPAQVGATVGLIGNPIVYWIDVDPGPVIVVQPTQAEGEKWSKEKLQPVLEDTKRIQGKVADQKSRSGENTIRNKKFEGGWIGIIGAESPRELRSRSAPRVIFDERDAYKRSAGEEGDPAALAEKRTLTFPNAFLLTISTPLRKGGPTEALYERSDKRRYYVACPHCGHEQVLRWGGKEYAYGLWADREEVSPGEFVDRPETAFYLCEANGCVIEEHHKMGMVLAGRWIAENPGAKVRGYHFNALISLFPGASWAKIVEEFLTAKIDPNLLQVWVNTVLAEPWEDKDQKLEPEGLERRAEAYFDAEGRRIEVPAGAGLLTAFVDVQHDRLEVLIRAWGDKEESWMIAHHRIYGDPTLPLVWQQLDAIRTREYRHEYGAPLRIAALGVDSGDGSRKNEIYDYVRPRQREGVHATKGQPARQREPIRRARADKTGVRLVHIGTHPMKATLFARLSLQLEPEHPVPYGYMHFRARDPEWHNGADAEFFAQFAREVPRRKRLPSGEWVTEWVETGPNEAIDLEVGNLAMLHLLGPAVRNNLATLVAQAQELGRANRRSGAAGTRRRGRRMISSGVAR
jgi:phage terminase large subunit GpA-like protein